MSSTPPWPPLPDDLRDAFELSVRLPETPGETLAFPSVQTCEQGEAAWVQLAADGQDPDELDMPAPLFTVTDPVEDEATADAAVEDTADEEAAEDDVAEAAAVTEDDAGSGTGWGVAGLVAGLIGAALGAIALLRTRRQA